MGLGETIRAWRLAKGWPQKQVAARSGLHQGMIANIEAGKYPNPTRRTLEGLARAFEVSLDELTAAAGNITPTELPEKVPEGWRRQFEAYAAYLTEGQREAMLYMARKLAEEAQAAEVDEVGDSEHHQPEHNGAGA